MLKSARTADEIEELLQDCNEQIRKGGSKYRNMTYEQGIVAVIEWLTGEEDAHPLED